MQNIDDHPAYHKFVVDISHKPKETKKEYFDDVIGEFVDQYLLVDEDAEAVRQQQQLEQRAIRVSEDHGYSTGQENLTVVPSQSPMNEEDDYVFNYGLRILEAAMLVLQLKDSSREGDGTRAAINEKILMCYFKSQNTYSKYAVEMLTAIAQKELILSPRMAEVVKREPFVNWRGGNGNNIDDDTAIEICNWITKRLVRDMGANKTVKAINLASRASVGIQDITTNYDQVSSISTQSSRHTTRSSKEDEVNMIKDLRQLRPFRKIPGRNHASFLGIAKSPLSDLDMDEYNHWVHKHVRQLTSKI